MTDQPDDFERGWQQYCDMKSERDSLRESLSTIEHQHSLTADQLEGARRALAEISTQRDWYMRRCVELETQFTTFGSLVAEAMQKRQARPHLPLTMDDPATAGQAIPKFLTEGLRELAHQAGSPRANGTGL